MSDKTNAIHNMLDAAQRLRVLADDHDQLAGTKTGLSAEARAAALNVRRAAALLERLVNESAALRAKRATRLPASR